MKHFKSILMLLFAFSFTGLAQQQNDYSKEPGYFDFGNILALKTGETITEVYLEEPLLKMVAQMSDSKEEGLGNMINGLKLIKVNEFMVEEKNTGKLEEVLSATDTDLQSKKWNRIIKTKQNENLAYVYVKSGGNNSFDGLVIIAVDKKGKVSLVNIVGKIDLATIGKLSQHFHFPNIDKMKEKSKVKK